MIDYDLAELYGTETKRLKETVRRNTGRFPSDFLFTLTRDEYTSLRTQSAPLEGRGLYSKYLPFAFTEQGVAMLASVLNTTKAIQVNISIVRAFVFLRQYALGHKELTEKLHALESKYDQQFKDIYEAILDCDSTIKTKILFKLSNEILIFSLRILCSGSVKKNGTICHHNL